MNIRLIAACSLAAALSVSASAAVQNAKPISQVAPAYSFELRSQGVEGEVVVGFVITKTGEVTNPVVVSSTDHLLDKLALDSVAKWRFAPATCNGAAISVRAVQSVAFAIPELHPDAVQMAVSKFSQASKAANSHQADSHLRQVN